jgi:hypothetical protein
MSIRIINNLDVVQRVSSPTVTGYFQNLACKVYSRISVYIDIFNRLKFKCYGRIHEWYVFISHVYTYKGARASVCCVLGGTYTVEHKIHMIRQTG